MPIRFFATFLTKIREKGTQGINWYLKILKESTHIFFCV